MPRTATSILLPALVRHVEIATHPPKFVRVPRVFRIQYLEFDCIKDLHAGREDCYTFRTMSSSTSPGMSPKTADLGVESTLSIDFTLITSFLRANVSTDAGTEFYSRGYLSPITKPHKSAYRSRRKLP